MATPRSQARRPRTRREGRGPGRPAHAPVAPSHARCVRHAAASGRPRAGARRRGRAYASVSRLSRRSAAYVARRPQSDRRGLTVRGDDFAVSPLAAAVPRTRGLPYGHHTVRMHRGAARTDVADKARNHDQAEAAPTPRALRTWRAGVSCYRCSYATYSSNVSMPKSRGRSKSRSRRHDFHLRHPRRSIRPRPIHQGGGWRLIRVVPNAPVCFFSGAVVDELRDV